MRQTLAGTPRTKQSIARFLFTGCQQPAIDLAIDFFNLRSQGVEGGMKIRLLITVLCVSVLSSCGVFKGDGKTDKTTPPGGGGVSNTRPPWGGNPQPPNTPQAPPNKNTASRGKVAHVDAALGFVVIDFTFSALPPAGLRFGVFRNGRRIGEITTTKMIDESYQVADINKGDIHMGDDVRLD
jgi:hypothetical protein